MDDPYAPPRWRTGAPDDLEQPVAKKVEGSGLLGCGCISGILLIAIAFFSSFSPLWWAGGALLLLAIVAAPLVNRRAQMNRELEKDRATKAAFWALPDSEYLELDRAACKDALRWAEVSGVPRGHPDRQLVEDQLRRIHALVLKASDLQESAQSEKQSMGAGFDGPSQKRLDAVAQELRQEVLRMRQLTEASSASKDAAKARATQDRIQALQTRIDATGMALPALSSLYAQAFQRLQADGASEGLPKVKSEGLIGPVPAVDGWIMPDECVDLLTTLQREARDSSASAPLDLKPIDSLFDFDIALSAAVARLQSLDPGFAARVTEEVRTAYRRVT